MSTYLTPAQFADQRQLSVDSVYALIASRALRAVDHRPPGSKRALWRIPAEAIEAFDAARQNHLRPAPEQPKPRRRRSRRDVPQYV